MITNVLLDGIHDAKVSWMIGWANTPDLHIKVGRVPSWDEFRHHVFGQGHPGLLSGEQAQITGGPYGRGRLLFAQQHDVARFVVESANGGGALGGEFVLVSGGTTKTNGGWSSGAYAMNQLRLDDEEFAAVCSEPLVEVIMNRTDRDWSRGGGMAGYCLTLSAAQEVIDRFLPGVELREVVKEGWVTYDPWATGTSLDSGKPDLMLDDLVFFKHDREGMRND